MSGAGGRSVARLKASYGLVWRLASSPRSCKMRAPHSHHVNTERRALAVKSLLLNYLRGYAARLEIVGTDIACNEDHTLTVV